MSSLFDPEPISEVEGKTIATAVYQNVVSEGKITLTFTDGTTFKIQSFAAYEDGDLQYGNNIEHEYTMGGSE